MPGRVKTIGVTGGIGSGKSAAVAILAELGALVIDADRVGHDVYLPGTVGWQSVVDAFGREVVAADGTIDRKRLGALVFADRSALARLNGIAHPLIREAIAERLAAAPGGDQPIVVEAALLVEAKWNALVDECWLVVARPDVVEARLVSQRGMDPAAIAARVRSQLSDAERAAHADVTIDNSGSLDALRTQIERLWRERLAAT
ncbi:MAG: dephospho-CoA kinase [bacterium]